MVYAPRTPALLALAASAYALDCDLSAYKAQAGLSATLSGESLALAWSGSGGDELRASFGIANGQPVVRELAAKGRGGWVGLGRDLAPEFHVTTGKRRISNQQMTPLRELGLTSPDVVEKQKWNVFWDSPLTLPGSANTNPGLPRTADEIRRAGSRFSTRACSVKTDGARIEVTFDGLSLGVFSGRLVFTVYKGANLVRQEAIAKTDEPSVAYKYHAGLKGFRTESARRVTWRDTARSWQKYEFGGAANNDPVALRARNRVMFVESGGGALAVFPPPHKFFFAREIELNLGYVWYRNDGSGSFGVGVRHGDREEGFRPYGASDELWTKRSRQARSFSQGNFALYNAPPGTWQRMGVYYFLSPAGGAATLPRVMELTHDDEYKRLPGHQVAVSHFHTAFHEFLLDQGSLDAQPAWIPTFKAMGINIAMMSDFHGDGRADDPGPLRYHDQHAYFEGCARQSDTDFLLMPGEEPDAYFGGHYTTVFPRPVYWTKNRRDGRQFQETDSKYGKVYHIANAKEELDMLRREGGMVWQAHPRTKGSSGYPEAIRNTEHFQSDRYLGASYQSLPVDLSEKRICEERCFGTLDDMNNWGAPKYLFAEGDTYHKDPGDDTYSHLLVNYVKLDRLPRFNEDWTPVLASMRRGDFFVTSGEVLIRSSALEGSGDKRTMAAEVEWTFPLDFVEVVWGDGSKVDRTIVSATGLAPYSSNKFRIPVDVAGKKWVRFAAWDSAGNGAFTQPVHVTR
jgi:hypothetical protein